MYIGLSLLLKLKLVLWLLDRWFVDVVLFVCGFVNLGIIVFVYLLFWFGYDVFYIFRYVLVWLVLNMFVRFYCSVLCNVCVGVFCYI